MTKIEDCIHKDKEHKPKKILDSTNKFENFEEEKNVFHKTLSGYVKEFNGNSLLELDHFKKNINLTSLFLIGNESGSDFETDLIFLMKEVCNFLRSDDNQGISFIFI